MKSGFFKSLGRVVGVVIAVLVVVTAVVFTWASGGMNSDELRTAEVVSFGDSPEAGSDSGALKAISFNIAFGGGLTGNPTDRHPTGEVRENLDSIAAFITEKNPDIVFLQEVDRPSSRTGRVDQFEYLLKKTGMKHGCFVSTWHNRWVPFPLFPFAAQIGGVHSGQAILSRYPVSECRRIPLPQPSENAWWYNRFFLRRAIQHAIVDVGGGVSLDAVNVHLEAFSMSNRREQAQILAEYVSTLPSDRPLVMAGDFNSLPPFTVQTKGFADEDTDFTGDDTIEIISSVRGLREVFIDDRRGWSEARFHTFPASQPTRRLDYVFYRGLGGGVATVQRDKRFSDHLPIVAGFQFAGRSK